LPPATKLSEGAEQPKSSAQGHALQSRKADLASVDDIILREAVRILADYTRLLSHDAASKLSAAP
jgi:hypothetical protein